MKKITFVLALSISCIAGKLSAQTNTQSSTTNASTEKGMDLYNAHQYKESITEFSKAIKDNPKDGKAYYYRGMAKMHDGQTGFCKDLEESLTLGYSTSADIYYYGCDTHKTK